MPTPFLRCKSPPNLWYITYTINKRGDLEVTYENTTKSSGDFAACWSSGWHGQGNMGGDSDGLARRSRSWRLYALVDALTYLGVFCRCGYCSLSCVHHDSYPWLWQQRPASFNITAKTDVCTLPINVPKLIIVLGSTPAVASNSDRRWSNGWSNLLSLWWVTHLWQRT